MTISVKDTWLLFMCLAFLPACLHESEGVHYLNPHVETLHIQGSRQVDVQIIGSDRDDIRVSDSAYYRIKSSYEFSIDESDGAATISVNGRNEKNHFYAWLEIHVPRTTPLSITVENVRHVTARGITGHISVNSMAGTIHLSNIQGSAMVQTDSGNVWGAHITDRVNVATADGTVHLTDIGRCSQISAQDNGACDTLTQVGPPERVIVSATGSDNIHVEQIRGDVLIESDWGQVSAQQIAGSIFVSLNMGTVVTIDTVGDLTLDVLEEGDVFAFNAQCELCHVETASGTAHLEMSDDLVDEGEAGDHDN